MRAWRRLRLLLGLLIAACGGDDVGGEREGEVEVAQAGKPTGEVTISNWLGYIDPGKNGTVAEFEEEYRASTSTTSRTSTTTSSSSASSSPCSTRASPAGRSIFVVTDWMAKQMYDLGYLQEIDHADLPNVFANILPRVRAVRPSTRSASSRSRGRAA